MKWKVGLHARPLRRVKLPKYTVQHHFRGAHQLLCAGAYCKGHNDYECRDMYRDAIGFKDIPYILENHMEKSGEWNRDCVYRGVDRANHQDGGLRYLVESW